MTDPLAKVIERVAYRLLDPKSDVYYGGVCLDRKDAAVLIEVARLAVKYGQHFRSCLSILCDTPTPCDCGYERLQQIIAGEPAKENDE